MCVPDHSPSDKRCENCGHLMTNDAMRITANESVVWEKSGGAAVAAAAAAAARERSLTPPPPPELPQSDSTFTAEPGELEIYCTEFGTSW